MSDPIPATENITKLADAALAVNRDIQQRDAAIKKMENELIKERNVKTALQYEVAHLNRPSPYRSVRAVYQVEKNGVRFQRCIRTVWADQSEMIIEVE
jgi:hypothetical protein